MSMMDGKKRQIDEEIRRLKNMKRFILHEEESVQLAMKAALDEPRLVERDREYLLVSDISAGSERKAAVEIAEHVRMQEKYHDTVGAVGSIYLGEDMDRGIYDRYVKVYTRLDKKNLPPAGFRAGRRESMWSCTAGAFVGHGKSPTASSALLQRSGGSGWARCGMRI